MHGEPGPGLLCKVHMAEHFEEEIDQIRLRIEQEELQIGLKKAQAVLPEWDRRLNEPH